VVLRTPPAAPTRRSGRGRSWSSATTSTSPAGPRCFGRTPTPSGRGSDLTAAWDPELREGLLAAGRAEGVDLVEGVYAGLLGPQYETPSEVRMLRTLGADAVGMSTVLECIAARWTGLRVCGVSLVTNAGAGYSGEPLTHEEVLAAGAEAGPETGGSSDALVADLDGGWRRHPSGERVFAGFRTQSSRTRSLPGVDEPARSIASMTVYAPSLHMRSGRAMAVRPSMSWTRRTNGDKRLQLGMRTATASWSPSVARLTSSRCTAPA
jgi:hypothetical protein